jgi:hypothetical protein
MVLLVVGSVVVAIDGDISLDISLCVSVIVVSPVVWSAVVVIDGDTSLDISVCVSVVVVFPVVLTVTIIIIIIIINVLDSTESIVYVDVVIVIDEYSTLPEVSDVGSDCIVWRVVCSVVIGSDVVVWWVVCSVVVGSDVVVWWVVCSVVVGSDVVVCSGVGSVVCSVVVGASQSIRKTCEWFVVISEILQCDRYELCKRMYWNKRFKISNG